jgi:hypothetical protein
MRCSVPLLAAALAVFAACVPSSSSGRTPSTSTGDSTPEATRKPTAAGAAVEPPVAEADPDVDPDVYPQTPLAVAPPPPARSRPVFIPQPSGPYRVHVVDEAHRDLPTFWKDGRPYVMGTVGSRYSVAIANPTSRRVEAVLSVDGLDAVDGRPANYVAKRGYIIPAYGDTTVDGFRTSFDEVATFRFSSVADSYAGRLGAARDVGVIGVAFFPERPPVAIARPAPDLAGPTYYPARKAAAPSRVSPDDLSTTPAGNDSPPAPPAAARAAGAPAATPPAEAQAETRRAEHRPGLGTEFGEARESRTQQTEFVRANAANPSQVVAIHYNDRAGLVALGIAIPRPYDFVERDTRLRETADPFRSNQFAQAPP